MKFGPVQLARAEGTILAHSLDIGDGRRMRKGQVLGPVEIALLRTSGHIRPIVAQLAPTDIGEDLAASRLAAALVPEPEIQGLRVSAAAQGGVFIYATRRGLLSINETAVTAANAVDPELTIATLPPYTRVDPDTLIGSIKTISYGIAARKLERAERSAACALSILPVTVQSADLIETTTSGGPRSQKGERAVGQRLGDLGITLANVRRVPHDLVSLADAIAASTSEMILILTASATSDRSDVAPAALRRVGGKIARFGMPVDPGHLLFYGYLGDRPVVGLPGCARSPLLNGVDFVIQRLACGLTIPARDFAAMGVGGLLKDTKARGLPRDQAAVLRRG